MVYENASKSFARMGEKTGFLKQTVPSIYFENWF